MRRLFYIAVFCGLVVACGAGEGAPGGAVQRTETQGGAQGLHGYPTTARAEYVFACMAANQMTQDFLYRCSCAIDTIATRLSYQEYERAETLSRIQLGHSPREEAYKSVGMSKTLLDKFFRAQAASELACF